MASTQQLREWWGPWLCDSSKYVEVVFPGVSGREWDLLVAEPAEALWQEFSRIMSAHGYLFREVAGGTYNCRKIATSGNWSTHAYGIAIDLNPSKNPYGTFTTNQPKAFREDILAIQVDGQRAFTWGGDWDNDKREDDKGPDPMHWQLNVDPDTAASYDGGDMAKEPLNDWAKASFQWAIDNGYYTEKTKLSEVREEYDIQQMVVMMHRIARDRPSAPSQDTIDIRVAGRVLGQ